MSGVFNFRQRVAQLAENIARLRGLVDREELTLDEALLLAHGRLAELEQAVDAAFGGSGAMSVSPCGTCGQLVARARCGSVERPQTDTPCGSASSLARASDSLTRAGSPRGQRIDKTA